MKKLVLCLVVLLGACQSQEEITSKSATDYYQLIEKYNVVFDETFEKVSREKMISTVLKSENRKVLRLDIKVIESATQGFLVSQGLSRIGIGKSRSVESILHSGVIQNPNLILSHINRMIDTSRIYSSEHAKVRKQFIGEMSNLYNEQDGYEIINSLNKEVIDSRLLNSDEKIQLLILGAQSHALLNFIKKGYDSEIYKIISMQVATSIVGNNTAKLAGCRVNWRDVWLSSVVGGAVGAAVGFKAGITGGTVTLPGVGTVAGAVGGTVFGGAGGFVSGALTGVAANLLGTCFRMILSQDAQCRQFWERYDRGELSLESIPTYCWPEIDFSDFTFEPL